MAKPLNPRQLAFVELYLAGNSATEVYTQAYACKRSAAESSATRLLADPRVQALVEKHRGAADAKLGITAEWFAARVKLEAEGTGTDSTPASRVAALRLAGMMLGILSEKRQHEHSGPGGGAIEWEGKLLSSLTAADLDALDNILGAYPSGIDAPKPTTPTGSTT